MRDGNRPTEDDGLEAPPGLIEALGESRKESVLISAEVDAKVFAKVRPRLESIRRRRARRRQASRWLALAAAFTVMAGAAQFGLTAWRGSRVALREDVNHDGRVDILDAFQLAREVKAGKRLGSELDFNGDGRVDGADVALIAKRAVSLEKRGRL